MRAAVVWRLHLDVEAPPAFVRRLVVLDARIREVHLIVEVRQVVLLGPRTHLVGSPIAVAVVVISVSVTTTLMAPPLVLALQFVIQHHAFDAPATGLDTACGVLVRAVDLDVVLEFPLAFDARVEGLRAVVAGLTVRLQEAASGGGQPDRMVARAGHARGLDQTLFTQVTQVATADIRRSVQVVVEITTGDHPERTNGRERARLGSPQRVLATSVVHDFALGAAREVHLPFECVPRRAITMMCTVFLIALAQVDDPLAGWTLSLPVSAARSTAEGRPCICSTAGALIKVALRQVPFIVSVVEVPRIEIHAAPLPIARAIAPCRTAETV